MGQQGLLTDSTTAAPDLEHLTGDDLVIISPDAAHNINLIGTAAQGISTSGAGNSITWTIADATDAQKGVSELATNAEAIAGADTGRTIVPSSLAAKLGAQTNNGLPIGAGSAAAITWTAAPTNGQILIGSTGLTPVLNTLTAGTGITVTNAAGTITIAESTVSTSTGQTVGAVTADILTLALGAVPGTYMIEAKIAGFEATGPNGVGYSLGRAIRTTGAAATAIGNQDKYNTEDAALITADASIIVSGNSAVVRVTGVAGFTIEWVVEMDYVFIS